MMTTTALPMLTTVYPLTSTANTDTLTSPNQGTAGKHVSLPKPQEKEEEEEDKRVLNIATAREISWEMGQLT